MNRIDELKQEIEYIQNIINDYSDKLSDLQNELINLLKKEQSK